MSDIQDLIHRSTMLAYEQGVKTEKERAIKMLQQERDTWTRQSAFSYKNALTRLIERLENE